MTTLPVLFWRYFAAKRRRDAARRRRLEEQAAGRGRPPNAPRPPRVSSICPSCGSPDVEDVPGRIPPRRCRTCGDRWAGLYTARPG